MSDLAILTGGAHRLGRVFADCLARLGYDLLLHYHAAADDAHRTQSELASVGVNVTLAQADLSTPMPSTTPR